MDRRALRTLTLALLAVVALAVVAATIDSTVVTEGGSSGFGAGPNDGAVAGESESTGFEPFSGSGSGFSLPTPCLPWLLSPTILGLIAGVFLLMGAYAYWRSQSFLPPIAIGLALGPPVILVLALLTACQRDFSFSSRASDAVGNISLVPPGGGGLPGGGAGSASSVSPPTALFGLLLLVALAAAVLMLVTSTGDSSPSDDDPEMDPDDGHPDVAAVGRAAGAAAERIESGGADVENEVFRAWGEMTALLDVPNRSAATPDEFATAAVDAGMDRDDVTELTTLFEAVRYGGAEATAERERRAVDALRNIEATYADADADDANADDVADNAGEDR
ncbi:DUF4129 domain-containing protein [Haloferax larsenii]|uniref:DUF4129 domain-containing protein n=1 Tax=Haloferax larsenii TaxID=302484 RepID=A0ABY5RH99_HALLR|nr:DUF4129 domain-containing protein [Haloferax larsenii]UVE51749.1 DUF4129 domain-containing protein [Haloferax larsenii]